MLPSFFRKTIVIDGCEYDVVAARMFRGSYGVKLIRR